MTGSLEDFFGFDNEFDLAKIKNNGYPPELQKPLKSMVDRVLDGNTPFVVPHLGPDRQLSFYLIASNARDLNELRQITDAYLGNVSTVLDPRTYTSSNVPLEQAVLGQYPTGFIKIQIPQEINNDKPAVYSVLGTINELIETYVSRPIRFTITHRGVGRILRDFIVACEHRNGKEANNYFHELEKTGNISARNLLFIELQALAANRDWNGILTHPELPNLVTGRLTTILTDLVLESVQSEYVTSVYPSDNSVDEVRDKVSRLRPVFSRLPNLSHDANQVLKWRTWAICAAALGYVVSRDKLPTAVFDETWLDTLDSWAGVSKSTEVSADSLDSLLLAEPTIKNAAKLLALSVTTSDTDGFSIYRKLSEYPIGLLNELEMNNKLDSIWQLLRGQYEKRVDIGNWSDWLQCQIDGAEKNIPPESLQEVCQKWEAEDWNEASVLEKLDRIVDQKPHLFRDATPILRSWLLAKRITLSPSLISQIMLSLAADEVHSVQDLSLMADLLSDLVEGPHTEAEYQECVSYAVESWRKVKSTSSLGNGLELMDILIDSPCAREESRIEFWNVIQEFCISHWSRLSFATKLLVTQLSETLLGNSDQFQKEEPADTDKVVDVAKLSGKRLGIYTLTESAGRRARQVLSQLFPDLRIDLSHDKSATENLKHLAKNADYFIFASKSAAHQAFYPVTNIRKDIIYPSGKGSSSIVSGFLEAVA